ncbi:MAG: single-stranded-DNA-specific exonuclease RecJ [Clostridia bacterium]|nr:single-stranded-DNA-specific exonuclease RecJ [Clostridia bacterium]
MKKQIIELLKKRGIEGVEEIEEFLSDRPKKTYDPLLLHNMEAGVDFILSAVREKKQLCIYGDYDADGITSVTLLMQFLGHLTDRLEYYIPSRFEEGYGLNNDALDKIKAGGADAVISVDCGSVSYSEVEHAKEIGLEIMVTDHHSITDVMADCILINPKQPLCGYPFPELCGCGIAFKLAQAVQRRLELPKEYLNEVLDLVAIGTIGDIVPLLDENRTLVKYGLKKIRTSKRPGLVSLIRETKLIQQNIDSENVAYVIVPHLNAAGRMSHAAAGVELLLSKDESEAAPKVAKLIEYNAMRRRIQDETFEKCMELSELQCMKDGSYMNFCIITSEEVHEGIAGIVAGKIKDRLKRPVIIFTPSGENGEFLKGSGRSTERINLYTLLKTCEDLYERFGGHAGACGMLIKKENFEAFSQRIQKETEQLLLRDPSLSEQGPDAELFLSPAEADAEFAGELEKLAPFGNKNERPLICMEGVSLSGVTYMGENNKHVRFSAFLPPDRRPLSCVLFGEAQEKKSILESGRRMSLTGSLSLQQWQGIQRVRFTVGDIFENNDTI